MELLRYHFQEAEALVVVVLVERIQMLRVSGGELNGVPLWSCGLASVQLLAGGAQHHAVTGTSRWGCVAHFEGKVVVMIRMNGRL